MCGKLTITGGKMKKQRKPWTRKEKRDKEEQAIKKAHREVFMGDKGDCTL